jgi:transcription antitermination factor NusG
MAWYVLLVAPAREQIARDGLLRRRFFCYWPAYQSKVRLSRGRKGDRLRAVIPGYIFLAEEQPDWARILEAPAISGCLRNGDMAPVAISEKDIAVIEAIEAAHLADPVMAEKGIPFRVGQRVRLTTDMLQQWEGHILAIDKRGRITLEIAQLFGRSTRIDVPAAAIEAA